MHTASMYATSAEAREAAKVDEIAAYIQAQPYDEGWHWIVETHDRATLVAKLREYGGSVKRVKRDLREYVAIMREQERNCAFE